MKAKISVRKYYGNKRRWTVLLTIGNQSFMLDPIHETKAEAQWTARMLRKALNNLQADKQ